MPLRKPSLLVSALLCPLLSIPAAAQSLTSGDVTGIVKDASGAVLPNATVTIKSNETGATETQKSSASGSYRFALLNPGSYSVSATATGFQTPTLSVTVAVGQTTTAPLQLAVASASTTVEVTTGGSLLQTENAEVAADLTPEQIEIFLIQATISATLFRPHRERR